MPTHPIVSRDLTDLTDLQLLILGALWTAGDATIAEVHAAVRHRTSATTKTIATILGRLELRGFVSHRLVGREGVYRAHVARREVLVARIGGVLGALFATEEDGAEPMTAAVADGASDSAPANGANGANGANDARLRELLRRVERDLDTR